MVQTLTGMALTQHGTVIMKTVLVMPPYFSTTGLPAFEFVFFLILCVFLSLCIHLRVPQQSLSLFGTFLLAFIIRTLSGEGFLRYKNTCAQWITTRIVRCKQVRSKHISEPVPHLFPSHHSSFYSFSARFSNDCKASSLLFILFFILIRFLINLSVFGECLSCLFGLFPASMNNH